MIRKHNPPNEQLKERITNHYVESGYQFQYVESINGIDISIPVCVGLSEKTPRVVCAHIAPESFISEKYVLAQIIYEVRTHFDESPSYAWVTDGKRNYYFDYLRQREINHFPKSNENIIEDYHKGIYKIEMPGMREFVESDEYMNLNGKVFPKILDVLDEWERPDIREGTLICGKGSGKSFACSVIQAKGVFDLLNMKDYRKTLNHNLSEIVLLNLSINGEEAKNVFFATFKAALKNSPWFRGRYKDLTTSIDFGNGIKAYSGHSKNTAWEGYGVYRSVLDEYDKFLNNSGRSVAEECYDGLISQSKSRFPHHYKLFIITSLADTPSPATKLWDDIKDGGTERKIFADIEQQ